MKKIINWRIFFIFLGASLISVACVFPYAATIQGELLKTIGQPIWLIFLAQIIQSIIIFALVIFLGLLFMNKKIAFLVCFVNLLLL